MMLTPEGLPAEGIDKIMLLSMWAKTLQLEQFEKKIIYAGMGKPTFPVNSHMVNSYLVYWDTIYKALQTISVEENRSAAIDYGDPRGDEIALNNMSHAMSQWYKTPVEPQHILFTVGGAGALRVIFETFNELYKDIVHYRVITPFPHYTLYSDNRHKLHPVNVMDEPGYKITATALQNSIKEAYQLALQDHNTPKIVLLCNPNNPLGTVLSKKELEDIALVLREYPDLKLVIDEAYAEMVWIEPKAPSLFEIAPDLKDRVTILRSATKAHSAAGERMGMLMTFNPLLMKKFQSKNISAIGHAPRSAQTAYASTMLHFDEHNQNQLQAFYEPKVKYVCDRLKEMQAHMPNEDYHVDGTFYIMADLSDLFGMDIPHEAKRALGYGGVVVTSEELTYSLLFKESLMIAPGEYFGLPANKGYCRLTCSGTPEELEILMNRIDASLFYERINKKNKLMNDIELNVNKLQGINPDKYQLVMEKLEDLKSPPENQHQLVHQNTHLKALLSDLRVEILRSSEQGRQQAAKTLQGFFKKHLAIKQEKQKTLEIEKEWRIFVDETAEDGPLKNYLLNLSEKERMDFKPWVARLAELSRIQEESARILK